MLFRIGLDQVTEHRHLGVFQRFGDGVRELCLAGLVDLVDGGQFHFLQGRISGPLNIPQEAALPGSDEQNRLTAPTGTSGATNAVHIGFRVGRNVVVQNVGDAFHVQAAGSHVGGHENIEAAILQLLNGAFALLLGDIAVDGGRVETASAQLLGQFLSFEFGAHKHNHGLKFGDFENTGERVQLIAMGHVQEPLGDIGVGAGFRLDLNLVRVVHVLLRQPANPAGHGCGEQCDLFFFRGVRKDAFHIFLETHVEHFVGLVKDEEPQLGNVEGALLQVVDDPPRGAHNDLGATTQPGKLNAVGLATIDREDGNIAVEVVDENLEGVGNLEG